MFELLELPFMQHAFISGVLISILCGIIGVCIIIKRWVFVSGGISHISFGGVGIAYYMGVDVFWGAGIFSILAAIAIGSLKESVFSRHDTLIGILWAVGMAVGILFIYLTPGFAPNLAGYLFGNILTVSLMDVLRTAMVVLIVSVLFLFYYKEFVALLFDPEFAAVKGIRTQFLQILFYCMVALTIVIMIEMVGIVLILALLTIPSSISLLYMRTIRSMIISSILISILLIIGGLIASFYLNIPSGPAIILPGALILFILRLIQWLRMRVFA